MHEAPIVQNQEAISIHTFVLSKCLMRFSVTSFSVQ